MKVHVRFTRFTIALAILTVATGTAADQAPAYHEQIVSLLKKQENVVTNVLPSLHPKRTNFNDEAPIPPQCYTKHEQAFNPCYVCHQNHVPGRENTMNDGSLQLEYAFSDVGMTNHWQNLFEDRSEDVAAISDENIMAWVNTDNYSALAASLEAEGFRGWIPDLDNLELAADAFDDQGFALDGSHWVAFNYKPLPSTFWPTNGSTDDVMIRLDKPFRSNEQGQYVKDIYIANLAILEAKVKGLDAISSLPIDENKVGIDLNEDGQLTTITRVTQLEHWVGDAQGRFIDTYLYPQGTEFLHTVRYLSLIHIFDGVSLRPIGLQSVRDVWINYDLT